MYWPKKINEPFGIKSEYSWSEIGAIYKIISDHNVGLFIETGVNQGDLAAWMLAKSFFIPDFHYLGITGDLGILDNRLEDLIQYAEQSFISVGICWSNAILGRVRKLIRNSRSPVMVFCDGRDVEKEFIEYFGLLRPGDVISSYKFPSEFRIDLFTMFENNEKIKRINGDYMKNTAIIAGELL